MYSLATEIYPGPVDGTGTWVTGEFQAQNIMRGFVSYIKFLPEELVVICHATVHFFLKLVNWKWWVLPICAGRTGQ